MAETERVIHKRYQLQRLIKQGRTSMVYQGFDLVLHRMVVVKVVSAPHVEMFRTAIRTTAQFSHPNIIGIYDLLVEPEALFIVQEYVDGEDFAVLLQTQQTPYQVADLGLQLCQALLYASSSTRKTCHGDLTPASVLRDRRGLIRINNFALPSDLHYFTSWSAVGGDGIAVFDRELPWGQQSEGRCTDDIRAVGLLMYQLLAGRAPGVTSVEPPADGRLRFLRNVPVELCEVIARSVVRQHPEHISTLDVFYEELKKLVDMLEAPAPNVGTPQTEDIAKLQQVQQAQRAQPQQQLSPAHLSSISDAPGAGMLVNTLPTRETMGQTGAGLSTFRADPNPALAPVRQEPALSSSPTTADASLNAARVQEPLHRELERRPGKANPPILLTGLAVGLFLFVLFFIVGYLIAHAVFP